ncbi:hypothetical protein SAMN02910298_01011 [Pseudobutyrivibrio sp. YE44]|uniref:hypothetical protein n=1 Tax=Pseudobutyrivibrio sp. YE44 TaxID=1520802 RepID=UPI0008842CBE|nr:hypothetical protein [Pseudobutyrivibrio sp. YE44]SDB21261.1 hypothetical protein SAMN02910298_01011 [Pseudobutyrivibrio sp. YE44]
MNVSGIRPSNGFYEDNQVKFRPEFNPIPSEDKIPFGQGPAASVELSREGLIAAKKQVEKAVSNMKEDTAIHRYQYFVQNKESQQPSVRGAENFTL